MIHRSQDSEEKFTNFNALSNLAILDGQCLGGSSMVLIVAS